MSSGKNVLQLKCRLNTPACYRCFWVYIEMMADGGGGRGEGRGVGLPRHAALAGGGGILARLFFFVSFFPSCPVSFLSLACVLGSPSQILIQAQAMSLMILFVFFHCACNNSVRSLPDTARVSSGLAPVHTLDLDSAMGSALPQLAVHDRIT